MVERPILFNGIMVRAILDGQKTVTRRAVKFPFNDRGYGCELAGNEIGAEAHRLCPFGKPGDRLWVRETFQVSHIYDNVRPRDLNYERGISTYYAAGGSRSKDESRQYKDYDDVCVPGWVGKMRPSIHMPRAASRILLEVTAVRVERLHDITEEQAQAEGFEVTGWTPSYSDPDNSGMHETMTPRDNFAETWGQIYSNWDANQWVWVVEFKRVNQSAPGAVEHA